MGVGFEAMEVDAKAKGDNLDREGDSGLGHTSISMWITREEAGKRIEMMWHKGGGVPGLNGNQVKLRLSIRRRWPAGYMPLTVQAG